MRAKAILEAIEQIHTALELDDTTEAMNRLTKLGVDIRIRVECTIQKGKRKRQKKGKHKPSPGHNHWTRLDDLASKAGYRNYDDYLKSRHWKQLSERYRAAWPTCACLVCDSPRFQLHHTRYDRLGNERLADLVPLCMTCHRTLHKAHRMNKIPLANLDAGLQAAFGWDTRAIRKNLEPFVQYISHR